MDEVLGPILPAAAASVLLRNKPAWGGVATYMLWDRAKGVPIYCGTAKTPTRLISHLDKDDLANRPVGKTHVNPELRAYCLAQSKGWLGIAFKIAPTEEEAKALERQLISHYGIARQGGRLLNQRLGG